MLFHGLNSHANAFVHIAKRFSHAGLDVIAFDQKGFGKSQGAKGYIPSYEKLVQANLDFFESVKDFYEEKQELKLGQKGLPVFLFG